MREVIRNAEEQANTVAGAEGRQHARAEGRQAVQHGQQAQQPVERPAKGRRQQGQGRSLSISLSVSIPGLAGVILMIVLAVTTSPWFAIGIPFFAGVGAMQARYERLHRAARHRAR